ncbi:hypothetical protein [Streptosporangium brasiliense]|uniref:Uncharacterized protein n=1 Tax=Streptosporangium brasiliense TaxID=47480 RepID=A0ABT9R235_9ACTN|nr:hypothetical protein [Streptosporangium brasiliense]MDP9862480.1 hypothetical protein [Streptosporangium brasiliense]
MSTRSNRAPASGSGLCTRGWTAKGSSPSEGARRPDSGSRDASAAPHAATEPGSAVTMCSNSAAAATERPTSPWVCQKTVRMPRSAHQASSARRPSPGSLSSSAHGPWVTDSTSSRCGTSAARTRAKSLGVKPALCRHS